MNGYWKTSRFAVNVVSLEVSSVSVCCVALSQCGTEAPPTRVHSAIPKPVNLHIPSKDRNADSLHKLMHSYSSQLGIQRSQCHAQSSTGEGLNLASGTQSDKAIARSMITTTHTINAKYIANAIAKPQASEVICTTPIFFFTEMS